MTESPDAYASVLKVSVTSMSSPTRYPSSCAGLEVIATSWTWNDPSTR